MRVMPPLKNSHHWCEKLPGAITLSFSNDATKPIGVATYRIVKRLPKELKGQLPGPEEIARLLEDGG